MLLIVMALVLVVGGGGAALYFATLSKGAYSKIMWACALVPPATVAAIVPLGVPEDPQPPVAGANSSDCKWSNLNAVNAGLQQQTVHMLVSVTLFKRDGFSSAESKAHDWLRFQGGGGNVYAPGTPIKGYGDEAYHMPRTYGNDFDGILFRDSNLFVDVDVAVENTATKSKLTALAWTRTQQLASLVAQQLRRFRQ